MSYLKYDIYKDLYFRERNRREEIRASVSTPVAALAFAVFNIGTLAVYYDVGNWPDLPSIMIAVLGGAGVAFLIFAAFLIIRLELDVYYYDPPDIKEYARVEAQIKEKLGDEESLTEKMQEYMAACFDIAYRRNFTCNERSARDRTTSLRFILVSMICISIAYIFLPLQ